MKTSILKVCRLPYGKRYTSGLNLKGDYLKQYGFEVGDLVKVVFSQNEIRIVKDVNTVLLTQMGDNSLRILELIESIGEVSQ